jgi:hypothetical protein
MSSTTPIMISDLICQTDSIVQFDKENVSSDFTNADINFQEYNFGIIKLKIKKTGPNVQKKHVVYTVDCSGSMNDVCEDGKTKMEHINHTLINMISYFAEHPELCVFITVFAFDGSIYNIIVNEEVSEENLDKLIQNIKKIRPKDMTNIETALLNSREYISNYIDNNPEVYVSHIFMTDGDATQGKTNPSELKELVSPLIPNIFVGFGIDHNAILLKELSSDSENKYYFVDALEKAGFVYGEILHSIIYKVLENTNISVVNGFIYDWKKNNWVNKIDIGDLVSENNKIFHILSDKPNEFSCIIQTTHCISKEIFEFTIQNSELNCFVDLTEYKYRQRTQQLLFEVNSHNFDINKTFDDNHQKNYKNIQKNGKILKEKMKNLLNEMKSVKIAEEETPPLLEKVVQTSEEVGSIFSKSGKDGIMKLLCDDIYICLQTFETKHSAMYSCARQTSQGAQRSYSATYTPKLNNNNNYMDRPMFCNNNLKRSRAMDFYTQDSESFDECDLNFDAPLQLADLKNFKDLNNEDEKEYDTEYTLSEQTDNPNSNVSILNLMRSFSANIDDNKLFTKLKNTIRIVDESSQGSTD